MKPNREISISKILLMYLDILYECVCECAHNGHLHWIKCFSESKRRLECSLLYWMKLNFIITSIEIVNSTSKQQHESATPFTLAHHLTGRKRDSVTCFTRLFQYYIIAIVSFSTLGLSVRNHGDQTAESTSVTQLNVKSWNWILLLFLLLLSWDWMSSIGNAFLSHVCSARQHISCIVLRARQGVTLAQAVAFAGYGSDMLVISFPWQSEGRWERVSPSWQYQLSECQALQLRLRPHSLGFLRLSIQTLSLSRPHVSPPLFQTESEAKFHNFRWVKNCIVLMGQKSKNCYMLLWCPKHGNFLNFGWHFIISIKL